MSGNYSKGFNQEEALLRWIFQLGTNSFSFDFETLPNPTVIKHTVKLNELQSSNLLDVLWRDSNHNKHHLDQLKQAIKNSFPNEHQKAISQTITSVQFKKHLKKQLSQFQSLLNYYIGFSATYIKDSFQFLHDSIADESYLKPTLKFITDYLSFLEVDEKFNLIQHSLLDPNIYCIVPIWTKGHAFYMFLNMYDYPAGSDGAQVIRRYYEISVFNGGEGGSGFHQLFDNNKSNLSICLYSFKNDTVFHDAIRKILGQQQQSNLEVKSVSELFAQFITDDSAHKEDGIAFYLGNPPARFTNLQGKEACVSLQASLNCSIHNFINALRFAKGNYVMVDNTAMDARNAENIDVLKSIITGLINQFESKFASKLQTNRRQLYSYVKDQLDAIKDCLDS